jgi:D-alanyl-D-alanine carboxypeptidase
MVAGLDAYCNLQVALHLTSHPVLALIGNGDGGTGEAFAKVLQPFLPVLQASSVATSSSTACLE